MSRTDNILNVTEPWLFQHPIVVGIILACLHVYVDIAVYSVLTQLGIEEPLIYFCNFSIVMSYYLIVIFIIINLSALQISFKQYLQYIGLIHPKQILKS